MADDGPLGGLCAYLLWLAGTAPDDWQHRSSETLAFMLRLFVIGPLPRPDAAAALAPALAGALGQLQREWTRMPLPRVGVGELARLAHVSRLPKPLVPHCVRAERRRRLSSGHAARRPSHSCCGRTSPSRSSAHSVGSPAASHFSHRFASIHGISPHAYRAAATARRRRCSTIGVRRLIHLLWG